MEDSQKRIDDEEKSASMTQQNQKVSGEQFETYLINALNDSLIKKSKHSAPAHWPCRRNQVAPLWSVVDGEPG